jgi:hypothetical protein
MQRLDYSRSITRDELHELRKGHRPRGDMDDKWFCFVEDERLFMHRSWTGREVFRAELLPRRDGGAVVTGLIRDADRTQFKVDDADAVAMFDRLLDLLAGGWV